MEGRDPNRRKEEREALADTGMGID